MSLTVRNLLDKDTVVFAKNGIAIRWQRNGDPMGEDVQRVPDSLADDSDFMKSVDLGVLEIMDADNPAIREQMAKGVAAIRERREAAQGRATEVLVRSQDRDLVSNACIGPGPNGGGQCSRQVLTPAAKIKEQPPLCPTHQHLAPQFVLTETGSNGENESASRRDLVKREWRQIAVTRR